MAHEQCKSPEGKDPPRIKFTHFTLLLSILFACYSVFLFAYYLRASPILAIHPEQITRQYYYNQAERYDIRLVSSPRIKDIMRIIASSPIDMVGRARFFSYLYDYLAYKLRVFLQPIYGVTFVDYPVIILYVLAALLIGLCVGEISRDAPAAITAASAFLISSQALLDSRFVLRNAKALASCLMVGTLMLTMRASKEGAVPSRRRGFGLLLISFCGCLTDEYYQLFAAMCLLLIFMLCRGDVRRWFGIAKYLLAGIALAVCAYFAVLYAVGNDYHYILKALGIARHTMTTPLDCVQEFILIMVLNVFLNNAGSWWTHGAGVRTLLALSYAAAGVMLVAGASRKDWELTACFLAYCVLMTVFFGSIVEWSIEIYYFTPPVAFGMVIAGVMVSHASRRRAGRAFFPVTVAIAVLWGLCNMSGADSIINRFVVGHGFDEPTRKEMKKILALEAVLGNTAVRKPVYVSYPQEEVSRINVVRLNQRVWDDHIPDAVYQGIVPVAYLRAYEDGKLVTDPAIFKRLAGFPPLDLIAKSRTFLDLPRGTLMDLAQLNAYLRERPGERGAWESENRSLAAPAAIGPSFVSDVPVMRLAAGAWRAFVRPSAGKGASAALLFVRSISPVEVRLCSGNGECVFKQLLHYEAAFEAVRLPLPACAEGKFIEILPAGASTPGNAGSFIDVIGPVVVPEGVPPVARLAC